MIIYKATNKINGKSYIGQTINELHDRKSGHLRSSKGDNTDCMFHNAILKYGKESFKWRVICECKDIDELNKMEKHYIKEYNTFIDNSEGYNMTTGGDGYIRSEENKRKIGKSSMGRTHTEEYKKMMSKRMSGKNNPMYGRDRSGKNNPIYGVNRKGKLFGPKYHNNETKEKIRQKSLRQFENGMPQETIEKLSRKVECPFCNKVGGVTAMKRWHFSNCKDKV